MLEENVREYVISSYVFLVKHIVAGPLSISWLFPIPLLLIALMIPPEMLSQFQLLCFFLIPIFASTVHAWIAMGGVDVVSVDLLCWSIFLLGANDSRTFKRVTYIIPSELVSQPCRISQKYEHQVIQSGQNSQEHEEVLNFPADIAQIVEDSQSSSNWNAHSRDQHLELSTQTRMEEEPYPSEILPRLRWVINLMSSDRLTRWMIGSKRHDSSQRNPPPTRLQYTVALIPVLLSSFLTLCVTNLLATHDPYFRNATTIPIASPYPTSSTPKPLTVKLLQYLLPPFALRPLTLGFYTWALLTFNFNLAPLLPVYFNYLTNSRFPTDNWSPHTLPPYFGPFSSVLDGGLRPAWGTWWHQHMRFMVLAPGLAVTAMFGLPRHSSATRTLLQMSAFFFSGIVHMGLVPPEPAFAKEGTSAMMLRLRIASFFWVQFIGCLVERVVEKATERVLGENDYFSRGIGKLLKRMVIIAWLLSWLCLTLQLLTVPFSELCYWDLVALPFFPNFLKDFLSGKWLL